MLRISYLIRTVDLLAVPLLMKTRLLKELSKVLKRREAAGVL
nr:MAG TPA: hypothetical protein [Caudoviricetes sp.]